MIWSDDTEVKVLETQNKICSAMYDHEKTDCKLSKESKKECAEVASVESDMVEDVLAKHSQMADFHKWLHQRQERGDPMPETRDELMQIYKIERPAFLMPKRNE